VLPFSEETVDDNSIVDVPMEKSSEFLILIIDDNEIFCDMLSKLVQKMGMRAACELTLEKGLEAAGREAFDVILLDVNLPDGCGLDIIPNLREGSDPPEIIIITGYGHEEGAEIAIKNHAWDYISKDASLQNLRLSLMRAVQYRQQKRSAASAHTLKRDDIIGTSPAITVCLEKAAQAAHTDSSILILGQTGTGKEVFARTIHDNSSRAGGDFVVVDCSALPDHLVESTLFGHKKGAYTSADSDRIGLVHQADNGTLFLDEIGELPGEIQKKFLRVLQEKRYRPLGGKQEEESDFRLVCATNRDLSKMVKEGRFRKDLYYRIRAMVIELPLLKDRKADIPLLVEHYAKRHFKMTGSPPREFTEDILESLQFYDWPGNVRELFNTLDCIFAEVPDESQIFFRHLPVNIRAGVARNRIRASVSKPHKDRALPADNGGEELVPLKALLDDTRCNYIKDLMEYTQGKVPEACRISGLSRGHLYDLLKKYNIQT
jgi:two-component system NtrC family response regulator